VRTTSLLRRAAIHVSLGLLVGLGTPAPAGADDTSRVIVTFADGVARTRLLPRLPAVRGVAVGPRATATLMRAADIDAVRALPGVLRVERDITYHSLRVPNDPCLTVACDGGTQWSIGKINAFQGWDHSLGEGITIAILDNGVQASHPDLAGKLVGAEIDETGGQVSNDEHGTAVAGTAAANTDNGVGIAGVGWNSRILSVQVLDNNGEGFASWISKGIYDATDHSAKVINLSLGTSTGTSQAVNDAIAYALQHNVVVVASAGNDSTAPVGHPASVPGVIGVGSSNTNDALSGFSNRGAGLDISAPGENLPAPFPVATYKRVSGTSFSAPIVSGVAAMLLWQGIELTPSDIQARMQETGVPLTNGNGKRVDAGAALALVRAYPGFSGGVRVASGELTGDPGAEVVTGAARGGGPHVRVLTSSLYDRGGFFAYGAGFTGGVDVAAGDVVAGGTDEIVTGAGPGGYPHVRIFGPDGSGGSGFYAYPIGFSGGVNVAVGDVDNDGVDEIVTGAGPGGYPHVRIFEADGTPIGGFYAYSTAFAGGVDVAVGDIDNDGDDDIITGAGPGGGPHVRAFRLDGSEITGFMAYSPAFTGGVRVGSLAGDGGPRQIVTGPGPGGGPHVRLFAFNGSVVRERFGFPARFGGGVDVALGPFGPLIGNLTGDTYVRWHLGPN
jgi:subtilisin family serine protease